VSGNLSLAGFVQMVLCEIEINSQFAYGLFTVIVYLLQSFGFVLVAVSDAFAAMEAVHVLLVALGALWVLALVLRAAHGRLTATFRRGGAVASHDSVSSWDHSAAHDNPPASMFQAAADGTSHQSSDDVSSHQLHLYRDCTSIRCALLRRHYLLSLREGEVVELIARGNSVASIAERLVVSENTVRTHMKRIYKKLAIHKRQELLNLLDELG
jgi:DNA-binding CsgD family transcriptional regulator